MNNRDQPCEERIDAELERELDKIRAATSLRVTCWNCGYEATLPEDPIECPECGDNMIEVENTSDTYRQDVLEVSPLEIKVRVGLSWGGPADGFYIYVDPDDREIVRIEYYYQDWYDGAVRRLEGKDFEAAARMFEWDVQNAVAGILEVR